jgi:hypothetical protein
MANRIETSTLTRSHQHQNDFAQVIERIGLAIMGALCGLFVAALVAKANIEAINSIGVLFSVVRMLLSASTSEQAFLHCLPAPPAAPYPTTFLATVAALVSIYDRVRRGSARHLEYRDRFLVHARRSPVTRRMRSSTTWTVHNRLDQSAAMRSADMSISTRPYSVMPLQVRLSFASGALLYSAL